MVQTVTGSLATTGAAQATSLPLALRMALLAGLVVVLTGCAGTVNRHRPVSDFANVLNAEAVANQSAVGTTEGRPASATPLTESASTNFPQCTSDSSRHRVRDLRVPWAQRRYLVADGTICSPNAVNSL